MFGNYSSPHASCRTMATTEDIHDLRRYKLCDENG
jgi:hypothetical protein